MAAAEEGWSSGQDEDQSAGETEQDNRELYEVELHPSMVANPDEQGKRRLTKAHRLLNRSEVGTSGCAMRSGLEHVMITETNKDGIRGWVRRGMKRLRDAGRTVASTKPPRTTAEFRARLDELRTRALDEVVSRLAQQPVRTSPDAVLGRRKRLDASPEAERARAARDSESGGRERRSFAPAPSEGVPATDVPRAESKQAPRRRAMRTQAVEPRVRLLVQGASQMFAAWSLPSDESGARGSVELRVFDAAEGRIFALELAAPRGGVFIDVPRPDFVYFAELWMNGEVWKRSETVRVPPSHPKTQQDPRVFVQLESSGSGQTPVPTAAGTRVRPSPLSPGDEGWQSGQDLPWSAEAFPVPRAPFSGDLAQGLSRGPPAAVDPSQPVAAPSPVSVEPVRPFEPTAPPADSVEAAEQPVPELEAPEVIDPLPDGPAEEALVPELRPEDLRQPSVERLLYRPLTDDEAVIEKVATPSVDRLLYRASAAKGGS